MNRPESRRVWLPPGVCQLTQAAPKHRRSEEASRRRHHFVGIFGSLPVSVKSRTLKAIAGFGLTAGLNLSTRHSRQSGVAPA